MYTGGNWTDVDGMNMPPHLHPDNLALTAPRRPTQDAVAQRFATEQAGALRFCHEARFWFVWDGAAWRRDRTGTVLRRLGVLARDLATNGRGESFPPAGRRGFLEGAERLARVAAELAVGPEDWPDPPLRLATPGGPVDLATGLALPAEPGGGMRRTTIVAPAPVADCPAWRRFVAECCGGRDEDVAFLQRFCGYALSGSTAEQVLLYVCGPGGTGKSLFVNTILHVMGEWACATPLALLTADPGHHRRDLAALRGARLVAVAESERGRRWDERRLKLLTGGDPVTTGTDAFTPRFKLIVTGNQPPRLDVVDEAVRRRLCLLPFDHRPAVPDRGLEDRLRGEAPAILRWMIEGAVAWHGTGLGRSAAAVAATKAYLDGEDVLGAFLAERCENTPRGGEAPAGALFAAWRRWAEENGEPAGTSRTLAEALAARGYTHGRSKTHRYYERLALRDPGNRVTGDAG